MAQRSLLFKVSIKLIGLWVMMFLLLLLSLVEGINHFFTLETFSTIETAQNMIGVNANELEEFLEENSQKGFLKRSEIQNFRNVQHLILPVSEKDNIAESTQIYLKEAYKNAFSQQEVNKRYTYEDAESKMFYVIRKVKVLDRDAFLISYMWDVYQRDLTSRLFRDGFKIMSILFVATIITALIIASSITAPVKQTERTVKAIMNQKWVDPPACYLDDEIGRLMQSVFVMQDKLRDRERESRAFLQSVSHDLKTPIMVIRSYAQAIKDDILIENSLEKTVDVIDREAEQLERRVKNLLFLNSLEKLYADKAHFECIRTETFFGNIVERFQMNERGIELKTVGEVRTIYGHREGLETGFSNIVENAIRFASQMITIELAEEGDFSIIRIQNDGPLIEEKVISSLFEAFFRHKEGHFGLGLHISKKIVDYHGGEIKAYNRSPWVVFEVKLPIHLACQIQDAEFEVAEIK